MLEPDPDDGMREYVGAFDDHGYVHVLFVPDDFEEVAREGLTSVHSLEEVTAPDVLGDQIRGPVGFGDAVYFCELGVIHPRQNARSRQTPLDLLCLAFACCCWTPGIGMPPPAAPGRGMLDEGCGAPWTVTSLARTYPTRSSSPGAPGSVTAR